AGLSPLPAHRATSLVFSPTMFLYSGNLHHQVPFFPTSKEREESRWLAMAPAPNKLTTVSVLLRVRRPHASLSPFLSFSLSLSLSLSLSVSLCPSWRLLCFLGQMD